MLGLRSIIRNELGILLNVFSAYIFHDLMVYFFQAYLFITFYFLIFNHFYIFGIYFWNDHGELFF